MSISFDASSSLETIQPAWLKSYPKCMPVHLEYPREPVWGILENAARRFPRRAAIRYFHETWSYEELWERARRAATLLISLGVKPGDRVGILLPNVPEYLAAAYGVWLAGGIVVSLSPLAAAVELDDLLRATDCKLIVALDLLAPLATRGRHRPQHVLRCSIAHRLPPWKRLLYNAACLHRRGFTRETVDTQDFMESLDTCGPLEIPVRQDPQSPAYILPTGGTTGHPKAVTLSHANLVANAFQLKTWCGDRNGRDTFLAVIPFFHSYGLSTCATAGIALAATLILHHRFQPEAVLDLIQSQRPSVFPAVPAMLHVLNQRLAAHPGRWDVRSLMWVISGGAPLPIEMAAEFAEHTGARVVEGYGLSECSPVTHAGPLDGSDRPGTIGLPLPDTDVRIVDPETGTMPVEPGQPGELLIRGPQVMLGYWNDPEATARVLKDGWLSTGDIAQQDEDGFFRIVDRKKDLIITSGFNVVPNEVEAVLKQFSGVKDAAVIGVPDSQRGEIVKAIVVVERKAHFPKSHFIRYLKENLSHHKVPRLVEYVEGDLPRNFLGKVLRRKLRDAHDESGGQDAEATSTHEEVAHVDAP